MPHVPNTVGGINKIRSKGTRAPYLNLHNLDSSLVTLNTGFPGGSVVKNLSAMQETQETWSPSLNQKDPLEEEMTTHSSIRAWRIPWAEEPGGLQSMRLQRGGHQ